MTSCTRRPSAGPKADWLVGINATRLFSVLYHRTLNIGRVMSPTLALIVQREGRDRRLQAGAVLYCWRWTCPVLPLPAPAWTRKPMPNS